MHTPTSSPHVANPSSKADSPIPRIAGVLAVVATIFLVAIHLVQFISAGALWRDEVNCINLSGVSTFSELWTNMDYDSMPLFFLLVLRTLGSLVGQSSDLPFQILGLSIGVLIIAALWLNARLFACKWPLISLSLAGFALPVIRYGDSVRGYGLGMLTILLTIPMLWRFIEKPTAGRWLVATSLAVASVQSLYYNAALLFAVGLAGAFLALRRKRFAVAIAVLGCGAVAAASLLPYLIVFRRVADWNALLKFPVGILWLWRIFSASLQPTSFLIVWIAAFIAILLIGAFHLRRGAKTPEDQPQTDRMLFVWLLLILAPLCHFGFLLAVQYHTQPWYYVTLLVVMGVSLDVIAASASTRLTGMRLGIMALGLITALPSLSSSIQERRTNVDLLAEHLNGAIGPKDIVLMARWECGITFKRYYRGPAEVVTIPPMEDIRFHRYDIIKRCMIGEHTMAPVLEKLENAMQHDGKVWLIGSLIYPPAGTHTPDIGPLDFNAKDLAWHQYQHYGVWFSQAGELMRDRALKTTSVPIKIDQEINSMENPTMTVFHGWKP